MASQLAKARELLGLAQQILDDLPIGLVVLSARGTPLWFNREAEIVCAVWNGFMLRRDALPLKRADFRVPSALWAECEKALAASQQGHRPPQLFSDPVRGLHATISVLPRATEDSPPAVLLQLDYRRPRSDRDQPIGTSALALLSRLSFREREVAIRVREGLTNAEIASELRRSPLTIKTQLAGIFRKLEVTNRARVAALLNR